VSEVNDLIIKKINKYPSVVAQVAIEAVRLASQLPQKAVEEALKNVLRQAARQKGEMT
jgi:hypothetical protein